MSKHEFLIEGESFTTDVEKSGEGFVVQAGESEFRITPVAPGLFSVIVDDRKMIVAAVSSDGQTFVDIDSVLLTLKEPSEDSFGGGAGDADEVPDKIFAPMPGKIVKLMVEVGQTVEPKQQAVIVEAMKMENPVLAKAKGKVTAINFAVGDQVDTDSPIIELELEE